MIIRIFFLLLFNFYFQNILCAANHQIRIVGSSTLYPFVTVVAERFGKNSVFMTPIVEATGTGAGMNLFCSNQHKKSPDIVSASRRIRQAELDKCRENSKTNITELTIGYDGVVLASAVASPDYDLDVETIFLAVAEYIPKDGKLVKNFYKYWNEIDNNLPNNKIEVYGPSFSAGTRDVFSELVMVKYCMNHDLFIKKYHDEKDRKAACSLIRQDGGYINMGDNDNLVVHKIKSNSTALGIIGFNFLVENENDIKAAAINGIRPSYDTISTKSYLLARPLFLYINQDHIQNVEGLKEFIEEFSSERAIGKYGYLTVKGFIAR